MGEVLPDFDKIPPGDRRLAIENWLAHRADPENWVWNEWYQREVKASLWLLERVEELEAENKALKDMLTAERGWKDPIVAGRFERARASIEADLAKKEAK